MKFKDLFLIVSLLVSSLLHADQPTWALPSAASLQAIFPPPPVDGTPAGNADLNYVITLQAHPSK